MLRAATAAAVGARRGAGGGGVEVGGTGGGGAEVGACARRAGALFRGAFGLGAGAAPAAAELRLVVFFTFCGGGMGGSAAPLLVRGGTKRARVAADPAAAPPLGFGALAGGIAPVPAPAAGGTE